MKRLLMAVLSILLAQASWALPDANDVMEKNFFAGKVATFHGNVSMTLVDKDGTRHLRKVEVWTKLKKNGTDLFTLTRFLAPADINGTSFLESENSAQDSDLWVFLPALGKSRRLVSQNKKDSFFGTDFSFGDIVLPQVSAYRHTFVKTENIDGAECFVIESVPAGEGALRDYGYSKKVSWIDTKSFMERKVDYYDLSQKLLKTQWLHEQVQEPQGLQRWVGTSREMLNRQTGTKTEYRIEKYDVGKTVADSQFSIRSLESI